VVDGPPGLPGIKLTHGHAVKLVLIRVHVCATRHDDRDADPAFEECAANRPRRPTEAAVNAVAKEFD
jgi:hypothetical protein